MSRSSDDPAREPLQLGAHFSLAILLMSGPGDVVNLGLGADQIAFDPLSNKILAASAKSNRVRILSGTDCRPLEEWSFSQPSGVAVFAGCIAVSEAKSDTLRVVDPSGRICWRFGSRGSAENELSSPRALAVHQDRLFIVDRGNGRVQVIDLTGKPLCRWNTDPLRGSGATYPLHVAVSKLGLVLVSNFTGGYVSVTDSTGREMWRLGERELRAPSAIAFDELGRVYVAERTTSVVKVYTPPIASRASLLLHELDIKLRGPSS